MCKGRNAVCACNELGELVGYRCLTRPSLPHTKGRGSVWPWHAHDRYAHDRHAHDRHAHDRHAHDRHAHDRHAPCRVYHMCCGVGACPLRGLVSIIIFKM